MALSVLPSPVNDQFASRTPLGTATTVVNGTTIGATHETGESTYSNGLGSVWYSLKSSTRSVSNLRRSLRHVPSSGQRLRYFATPPVADGTVTSLLLLCSSVIQLSVVTDPSTPFFYPLLTVYTDAGLGLASLLSVSSQFCYGINSCLRFVAMANATYAIKVCRGNDIPACRCAWPCRHVSRAHLCSRVCGCPLLESGGRRQPIRGRVRPLRRP